MPEPVITISSLILTGKVVGSVMTLSGLIFGVFRVINWIKTKFINIDANVTALKNTMETGFNNLSEDIKSQTTSMVSELKEQRQDFRTFYAPILMMQQQSSQQMAATPARAKRSPQKKK